MPGPSEYESKPLINGTGSTFFSNIKSSTSKTIAIKLRKPVNKFPSKYIKNILTNLIKAPGPGAYCINYTDFAGNLDYNKYYDKRNTQNSINRKTYQTYDNNQYFSTNFKKEFFDSTKNTNENTDVN